MEFDLWFTLALFGGLILVLIFDVIKPVYAFTCVSFCLILLGVIEIDQFISSFANQSILTIFLLIFIAKVVRDNYNIIEGLDRLFNNTRNPRLFVFKKSLSVSALSSLMNNTPIVAMLIPYSIHWSKEKKVSASKLLLPLSFAAITGGMITVIGTSTNLVLNGFLEANQIAPLGVSDYILPGILVSIGAAVYSSTLGFNLLPNVKYQPTGQQDLQKNYLVECSLVSHRNNKECNVETIGLRQLEDVFLAEVIRKGRVISPVTPQTVLEVGDRLFFAGDKEAAIKFVSNHELLDWSKTQKFNISKENAIVEAVVPYNSNLANSTLRKFDFRLKYNSAVIGIHRNGEKLKGKLGSIVIRPGDLLIIIAGDDFNKLLKNQQDIYVINGLKNKTKIANSTYASNKRNFAIGCALMVTLTALNIISFFTMLLGVLGVAFLTKLTNSQKIKQEFNLELLMILGSAISLGIGMNEVGAGHVFLEAIKTILPSLNSWGVVVIISLITVLLTNFITNVAAVSIVFPIAFAVAPILEIPMTQLFLIVAFSASAAFITPVGYQTNIMVMGPGGYSQKDFFKFGIPMTLIYFGILIAYLKLI